MFVYIYIYTNIILELCTTKYLKYITIYIVIYFKYFVVHNSKILLLTIHQYFMYIFVKASNIQYDQIRILNYALVLTAAYFTHCS